MNLIFRIVISNRRCCLLFAKIRSQFETLDVVLEGRSVTESGNKISKNYLQGYIIENKMC